MSEGACENEKESRQEAARGHPVLPTTLFLNPAVEVVRILRGLRRRLGPLDTGPDLPMNKPVDHRHDAQPTHGTWRREIARLLAPRGLQMTVVIEVLIAQMMVQAEDRKRRNGLLVLNDWMTVLRQAIADVIANAIENLSNLWINLLVCKIQTGHFERVKGIVPRAETPLTTTKMSKSVVEDARSAINVDEKNVLAVVLTRKRNGYVDVKNVGAVNWRIWRRLVTTRSA